MTLVRVSSVRVNGEDREYFLPRLARAEAEHRVLDPALVNAMLRRGKARRVPRRLSLSEYDGDWS